MKDHLSGILSIKRDNLRRIKKELFSASGMGQKFLVQEALSEQRQIDHILYLSYKY